MLSTDPVLKQQVIDYLEGADSGEFTSSWLSQELGADDLGYADSDSEDIHVIYVLADLRDEGLVDMQLWGQCVCGCDAYRTEEQGSPRCLNCGHDIEADTPLYSWREQPTTLRVSDGPRLRQSPLAGRTHALLS